MRRTEYSRNELLAEPAFAERIRYADTLFHGGLAADGTYLPPRSRYRPEAIQSWTEGLRAQGHETRLLKVEELDLQFFPNVEQSKLLLRHGARGAMTRILTLIGITEGFGNDGLKLMPALDWPRYFREPVDGTCLVHLSRGLFEAHGMDEAGSETEAGHDRMWFALRDAALNNPEITPDMWENLPIAPPPGYSGPAKPAAEAIGVGQMQLSFPTLDPMLEVLLMALSQLLFIEIVAGGTFAWAKDVLSDPACSAAPEFAPRMVDFISADEDIHVAYLQCALSEARARTFIDQNGDSIAGSVVMGTIRDKVLAANRDGARRQRLLRYRLRQIEAELAERSDGAAILEQFRACGPMPES